MNKIIVVDHEKCTGCRNCEMACSVFHVRACNPNKSAVRIVKWEREGLDVPTVCQQCEEPACADICPVQAISRDADTGAMIVDRDLCVGCRMCIVACPFGAVTLDRDQRQAIKCDLCGGVEPWCVRVCEPGALTYQLPSTVSLRKKRAAGRRLMAALKGERV
ncbi:MAG: 4Fe-4S dicluster domain-containing protein [Chloroflexi bacterium]|nr:4Fe-4S dicluster domain-containing protein [Chloroflexota bacterium]MBU1747677.1 4Fe-4S dicluster domain-containing protein [Chloroflexota bacterium]